MRRALALLSLSFLLACGHGDGRSDEIAIRADADKLGEAMSRDPATRALGEVDGFIQDRRPVLAAQTIESGALPAVRRHIAIIEGLSLATPEVQAAQQQARRAYRHRESAITAWAHVLARGEVEDADLLAAIHDERMAEQEIVQAIDAVAVLRGGHAGRAVPHVKRLHEEPQ